MSHTLVVGVKLDLRSKELLTWSLLKVAKAGDRVIALHVIENNETVDPNVRSSLLSPMRSFDSLLEVYEGFCNLKQIDIKLKISRGPSVKKVLVDEAKSYFANQVIVGISQNHHKICSSASVAKYCGKKLPKDCSVFAVNNGKIVFHKESNSSHRVSTKEIEHHGRNCLLNALQRSFSKRMKALNDGQKGRSMLKCDQDDFAESDNLENNLNRDCSICSPSCEDNKENSMTLVRVNKSDSRKEIYKLKPGWPLLCPSILYNKRSLYDSHMRQNTMVPWAMVLPRRYCLFIENSKTNYSDSDSEKDRSCELNEESGAILPKELEGFREKYSGSCRLFKFHEIISATSNFKPENMIGKGGSSQVYKGCLPEGREIAVKVLKPSENALKEFVLEIEIITALHHKNILSLFGFCFEENRLLLVYEFLSRGSLEQNLHGAKKDPLTFNWCERYKVAVGVAEALDYLHNRENQPVIHRDVKSSNILISDDYEPQLSDFGLAKWAATTSSHIACTDVAGTFGYLAPEYFMYGKVNEKIDVYAYGVVLLELLSGKKPISNDCPKGHQSLVMWAKPFLHSGKFTCLLDPTLGSCYDNEQVERMVLASSLCIRRAPRARPQMNIVLKLLQGDIDTLKWARLQVTASERSNINLEEANTIEDSELLDNDTFSQSNLRSHLNLALLGVEEDSLSESNIEKSVSLEDYL